MGPTVRGWVDDLTAYTVGREECKELMQEGCTAILEYMQAGYEVNKIKSGALGTSPKVIAAMTACSGELQLPVATHVNDLGIVQGTSV